MGLQAVSAAALLTPSAIITTTCCHDDEIDLVMRFTVLVDFTHYAR